LRKKKRKIRYRRILKRRPRKIPKIKLNKKAKPTQNKTKKKFSINLQSN
jgi:hypothetical protein